MRRSRPANSESRRAFGVPKTLGLIQGRVTYVADKDGTIREDYGYNQLQKDLFEGEGIYKILDKYVSKPGVAQVGGRTDTD